MYKLHNNPITGEAAVAQRLSDNTFIPFAPDNTDYQVFLLWKAEGNEPLPADEPQS